MPKHNRTGGDNIRVTQNDFMSIELIELVLDKQQNVVKLFNDLLGYHVVIEGVDTSDGIKTVPFPAMINAIERNVGALKFFEHMPRTVEPTVHWLGERNDSPRLSYRDVNRWFESLEIIESMIRSIYSRSPITGSHASGPCRTSQILRRVYT